MTYFFIVTIVSMMIVIYWLVKRQLRLIEKLEDINEKVEESLDVLDQSYARLSKLLETPVLFDDPIVVEMIESAKSARDAILVVANNIVEKEEDSARPEA